MPTLPVVEREYQEFWRTPGIPMWKPFVVVILGAVGFFAISLVITLAAVVIDGLLTPGGFTEVSNDLLAGEVSRLVFIANSVALGLMIPLAFLLQRFTGQPAGFLSSVVGRTRWGWLLTCFWISLLAVAALTAIELGLGGWAALGLELRPGWLPLLAAILVVTPFQAAGEEYLIRGVLFRAAGSLVPHRWVALGLGAAVSSFVFMLLHGAADPWLNLMYFCMGLLFCYLTWRTGGLEAAIAMHAANNLVGLTFVPFQEWGGIFDRSAGVAGPIVLVQLVLLLVAAAVIEVLARRRAMVTVAAPAAPPAPAPPPELSGGWR
ncbi:CPBP family intramembrane metalloprotease [Tessaracoccus sp. OS52]|uniref:CPBP family intramembrane glutamic endopeptidase n=1 Tax=Tessaracoccus sp. OS52 TaxID=2886691 RepID=UPI001D11DC4D|nr:type II CAAX endopeptidase family protein [Tessaracoccus sp. OS52]MCC2592588.1 CPBP family intramembrane metalloprotease [Tessaracoccus sp. OS52]